MFAYLGSICCQSGYLIVLKLAFVSHQKVMLLEECLHPDCLLLLKMTEGHIPEYPETVRGLQAAARHEFLLLPSGEDPENSLLAAMIDQTECNKIADRKKKLEMLEKLYRDGLIMDLNKQAEKDGAAVFTRVMSCKKRGLLRAMEGQFIRHFRDMPNPVGDDEEESKDEDKDPDTLGEESDQAGGSRSDEDKDEEEGKDKNKCPDNLGKESYQAEEGSSDEDDEDINLFGNDFVSEDKCDLVLKAIMRNTQAVIKNTKHMKRLTHALEKLEQVCHVVKHVPQSSQNDIEEQLEQEQKDVPVLRKSSLQLMVLEQPEKSNPWTFRKAYVVEKVTALYNSLKQIKGQNTLDDAMIMFGALASFATGLQGFPEVVAFMTKFGAAMGKGRDWIVDIRLVKTWPTKTHAYQVLRLFLQSERLKVVGRYFAYGSLFVILLYRRQIYYYVLLHAPLV